MNIHRAESRARSFLRVHLDPLFWVLLIASLAIVAVVLGVDW